MGNTRPLPDIDRYIEEIAGESCGVVSFTGGESTLYPTELEAGIKKAKGMGLRTCLVTNAWWAEQSEKAYSYISHLRELGLEEFNFSFDEFHSPYLSIKGVRNVLEAVAKVDFKYVTMLFVMNNQVKSAAFLDTLIRQIGLFSVFTASADDRGKPADYICHHTLALGESPEADKAKVSG